MSELNAFLVPVDEPGPKRRAVGKKVLAFLEEKGIVDGHYDDEPAWYAAGPNSSDLFSNVGDADDPAFEYAIIYDQSEAHFVPDSHTAGFGAACTNCGFGLDEALYEALAEQGEGEDAVDMVDASIECPGCRHANPLVNLKAEIPTAVTRFYINFCAVDSADFSREIVEGLENIVGAKLRVIPEQL